MFGPLEILNTFYLENLANNWKSFYRVESVGVFLQIFSDGETVETLFKYP